MTLGEWLQRHPGQHDVLAQLWWADVEVLGCEERPLIAWYDLDESEQAQARARLAEALTGVPLPGRIGPPEDDELLVIGEQLVVWALLSLPVDRWAAWPYDFPLTAWEDLSEAERGELLWRTRRLVTQFYACALDPGTLAPTAPVAGRLVDQLFRRRRGLGA